MDALASLLYPDLKNMARRRSLNDRDFGATVLVNETFAKLLSSGQLEPDDRQQFFALAATVMRQVVVDELRYASAQKRSADAVTYSDTKVTDDTREEAEFVIQVSEMVERLAAEDARMASVFECRYFAGFSTDETAEVLDLSSRTVERLWASARSRIAVLMDDSKQ